MPLVAPSTEHSGRRPGTWYDGIAEKLLIPSLDRWQGNRAYKFAGEVRRVVESPLSEISGFQLDRIRKICQYAWNHSEFYRERFDAAGIRPSATMSRDEFRKIPPLTKLDIREQQARLVSGEYDPDTLRKTATGGTTSSPTPVYMDWPAYHRRWAGTYVFDRQIGYVRGRKIAYLWGARQDFDLNPSWKQRLVTKLVTRNRYFSSGPLDDETMTRYHAELKRWRPEFLQAYPTALAIFAEFLIREKLALEIPNISVTAEPLLPHHAELIHRAFGCRPFNWYGARELGRIATECDQHAGMHINVYGNHVEIGEMQSFAEPGMGPVLITDLWNTGMPLIRYAIGDVASITNEPCPCGSALPRITNLAGRTTDVFCNSRGQHVPGVAFPNRLVRDGQEIREMQIIQLAVGKFEIRIVPGPEWDREHSSRKISEQLSAYMLEPTESTVVLVDAIPREASGKLRVCKNLVDLPASEQVSALT